MVYKGIEKVLNIGWGWMLLLVFVFPAIGMVLQFVFLALTLFSENTEIHTPVISIPMFLLMGVFFTWMYVISKRLNNRILKSNSIDTKWFNVSFYACLFAFIFLFIYTFSFDYLQNINIYIEGWVFSILSLLNFILMLAVTAAYIYCTYFTSIVLKTLFKDIPKRKGAFGLHSVPYFGKVWVFPIGMPLINAEIKKHYGSKPKKEVTSTNQKPTFKSRTYDNY